MAVIGKGRCPACAKLGRDRHSDNLILYSDGGEHCFSCGYHKGRFKGRPKQPLEASETKEVSLPHDLTPNIPPKALSWLSSYHITWQDIIKNNILWSESLKLLVFPLDNAWIGRYFGTNVKHPKWYSVGKLQNIIHILGTVKPKGTIVLVEDMVSAIRVSKQLPTLCLFSADISTWKLNLLKLYDNNLCWWLDKDKQKEAAKQAIHASSLGINIRLVVTDLDPKCYSDNEIKNILDRFGII